MQLKNLFVIMMAMMIFAVPLPVSATESPPDELIQVEISEPGLKYVDVQNLKGSFSISNSGKASIFGYIWARTAEKTKVKCVLMRYEGDDWENYKTWSETNYSGVTSICLDYYVHKGYKYKLFVYGYAWVDGVIVDRPVYESDIEEY